VASAIELPESIGMKIPRRHKAKAGWNRALDGGGIVVPLLQNHGTANKRAAVAAALSNQRFNFGQLASLLDGFSTEALSVALLSDAGALALTFTPCSRSSAIFSALSFLASGGT
jgi:hypothetical protein